MTWGGGEVIAVMRAKASRAIASNLRVGFVEISTTDTIASRTRPMSGHMGFKPMIIRKLPIIMQLLMKVQKKEVLLEDVLLNGMGIISPDGASTVVTELTLPALELVLFPIKDNYLIPFHRVSDSHPYFVYIVSP